MYAIYSWGTTAGLSWKKKGSSLNAAALWINALDLQIFLLLFLFISQQLLRPQVGAVYFVTPVVEFGFYFVYGI